MLPQSYLSKSALVKLFTKFLVILAVLSFSVVILPVKADPQSDLNNIQNQISEIKKKKAEINKAISSEKNKEGQYNNELRGIARERDLLEEELKEKELTIAELNLQIQILNDSIITAEATIAKTKAEIDKLEDEADKQLTQMYLDIKTHNNGLRMIFTDGNTDFVKQGVYQKTIQDDTNNALVQLEVNNNKLKEDKKKLEENRTKVEQDKVQLDAEKKSLDTKQAELQTKISRLNALRNEALRSIDNNRKLQESLSDQEAKLLAEQELIQQRIFNQVKSVANGSFVKRGTIIGYQGLTGLTTGYHLHFGVKINNLYQNPCGYMPAGKFGNCAGNGQLSWPFSGSFYYTSSYGPRNLGRGTSSFHYAIDIAHAIQNAPVMAAHDGWFVRGFQPCDSRNSLCKAGGANYVILCENKDNCNSGLSTLYWHLK